MRRGLVEARRMGGRDTVAANRVLPGGSGVMPRSLARPSTEVRIVEVDEVPAIVDAMEVLTMETGFSPHQIVDLFPLFHAAHWAAYAAAAGLPAPSPETIVKVATMFMDRARYWGNPRKAVADYLARISPPVPR